MYQRKRYKLVYEMRLDKREAALRTLKQRFIAKYGEAIAEVIDSVPHPSRRSYPTIDEDRHDAEDFLFRRP